MPYTDSANRVECADCGYWFSTSVDQFGYSDFGGHLHTCDNCEYEYCGEQYTRCPDCGYSDDDGYGDVNGIHDYSYRPRPIWFGGRNKPYYLGFELEVSSERFNVQPIYDWCTREGIPDFLYCKEDGSVEGFEIVSHPMTPEFFDTVRWDSFFTMLNEEYPTFDGTEPSGHGLHVHVSRTAFPYQSTLARWSYMLNTYQNHVRRVARRTSEHWARFTDKPVTLCLPFERAGRNRGQWQIGEPLACGCCFERVWIAEPLPERMTRQFQSYGMPERYQAVNLTNSATVEVRVFKSTRAVEEFVSSLHFVAATVEFVRTMQPWHATKQATSWETFADYVARHPVFAHESDVLAGIPAN